MKRAIIIHCWEGYPNYCWYQWVKKELEKKDFEVLVPAFPETELPKQDKWVPYLAKQVGTPDENLYLIGHSVGCVTIMRYLETLEAGQKIGGAVLVAGYTDDLGFKELENFFQTPLDFEKIKTGSKNGFVAIHSDNDQYVDMKYADILKEKMGADVVVKHAMGHFSGPIEKEESCTELPDVVQAIERLSAESGS